MRALGHGRVAGGIRAPSSGAALHRDSGPASTGLHALLYAEAHCIGTRQHVQAARAGLIDDSRARATCTCNHVDVMLTSTHAAAPTEPPRRAWVAGTAIAALMQVAMPAAAAVPPATTEQDVMQARAPPQEQVQSSAHSPAHTNAAVSEVAASCPDLQGIGKYVCYGECCSVPWGPGGPICLALAGGALRYAMPYTFSGWLRRDIALADKERAADMRLDKAGLAFAVALFASAAPRSGAGLAYSFAFVIACLV